jgi:hypothetical protein
MNSNSTIKLNLQWEVDRYLLCDPSLDRDAFEQRMLEDFKLAELVANSVADLQSISSAVQANRLPVRSSPIAKPKRIAYIALLITAALVLLTVSVRQLRQTATEAQLSQIADNWVAFEGLTTGESLDLIATEYSPTENQVDSDANEQSDWLVEAAQEFYLAMNEGVAG